MNHTTATTVTRRRARGDLPRVVRSADQRPRRHHHPRRRDLRPHHRRDPPQPREVAPLFTVDERVEMAREVFAHEPKVVVDELRRPAGRLRPAEGRARDRPRAAGDLRLRVRVPDGADEPPAGPGARDGVHDAGRVVHLHQLPADPGGVRAGRADRRPRPRGRGSAHARRRARLAIRGPERKAPRTEECHGSESVRPQHRRIADDGPQRAGAAAARAGRVDRAPRASASRRTRRRRPRSTRPRRRWRAARSSTRPTTGIPSFKKAIVRYTEQNYGRTVSPKNVIVCSGAKQAIFNALWAILDPGDEVILLAPYWVSYPEMVKMCRAVPVVVTPADGALTPSFEQVQRGRHAPHARDHRQQPEQPVRAWCSPATSSARSSASARSAASTPSWTTSTTSWSSTACTAPSCYDFTARDTDASRVIVVNGIAKTYGMTGFRIGWAIASADIVDGDGHAAVADHVVHVEPLPARGRGRDARAAGRRRDACGGAWSTTAT